MLTNERQQHRAILQSIAFRAMIERGLLPNFSTEAITALDKILPRPSSLKWSLARTVL